MKYYENTKTSSDTLFHTKTVLQSKSKDVDITNTCERPSLQLLAGTEFHPSKNSTHHFCHSKKTSPTSAVCICCTHNASFTSPTTSGRRSMLTNAEKKRLPQHKQRHTHTHVVTWQQYSNAYEYSFYLVKETIDVQERLTNFLA